MPIYGYRCTVCDNLQEEDHSINGFKENHPICDKCGSICNYEWIPSIPNIVLRDGPSGSWPSKGERIKKQREKASEAAARRQRDRYGEGKQITPNAVINGSLKETGSWAEAQNQILKERGPGAAKTFEDRVQKEKAADKSIKVYR
jgi:hypothetical protein